MFDSVGGSEKPGSFNLGKNENTKKGELTDELMRCDSKDLFHFSGFLDDENKRPAEEGKGGAQWNIIFTACFYGVSF